MFRIGYNTNGLAHHRLDEALDLLAGLGYEGVALTPDVGHLDPFRATTAEVRELRARADDLGLELALETGARFLLDPRRKHFPTLLEESPSERARRADFLARCAGLAAELGAGVVSIWSGAAPDGVVGDAREPRPEQQESRERTWSRLVEGVRAALSVCRHEGVRLAFEPEPGMFVERPAGWRELTERMGSDGQDLGLCLDVGHLVVTGDLPVRAEIRRAGAALVHVHLDDAAAGRHEHRLFGCGELDLPETLNALLEEGYAGMAAVELSRDSHRGAWAAETALARIREALGDASSDPT